MIIQSDVFGINVEIRNNPEIANRISWQIKNIEEKVLEGYLTFDAGYDKVRTLTKNWPTC